MPDREPTVILDSSGEGEFGRSWRFAGYVTTVAALTAAEAPSTLRKVEKLVSEGLHAVGFVAYEAATALNPDLPSLPPMADLPLVWFAIFSERRSAEDSAVTGVAGGLATPELLPSLSQASYQAEVSRIREYIASGDSYQVNYTFRLSGAYSGDPFEIYRQIAASQGASFCAFIDTGKFALLSASPELFFSHKEGTITARPMKGTAARGRWPVEDAERIIALKGSAKERAENLMIVDLLRNDLGIIARTGSVKVETLFAVETYPTLHQMTSTVSATLKEGTGLTEILAALFPCGSVTGAPKRRSMEIIRELEGEPRGVYCGAIGYLAPGGEALFSVAIRTLLLDKETQQLSLGIGSGITTDSTPEQEYRECLTKAAFLAPRDEEFSLIESIRLENGRYYLLERHLERLRYSARFFGFKLDECAVRGWLERQAEERNGIHKVRLVLAKSGGIALSSEPVTAQAGKLRVTLSRQRVESGDHLRYHKTTCRDLFNSARAERPDCDELLFLNERGELTEGSYHNLLIKIGDRMLTPPTGAGLLPGVMRQELLQRGEIVEETLYPADLAKAEEIWLINSVRGIRPAVFVDSD